MEKISSHDAASLLKQAGAAIRKVTNERDEALAKVASYERDNRVTKLARQMEEKGLAPDLTFEQKVASVKKSENLDVTEEAIKMAAPQGRIFGNLGDVPSGGGSSSPFEQYILSGEDPSSEE